MIMDMRIRMIMIKEEREKERDTKHTTIRSEARDKGNVNTSIELYSTHTHHSTPFP